MEYHVQGALSRQIDKQQSFGFGTWSIAPQLSRNALPGLSVNGKQRLHLRRSTVKSLGDLLERNFNDCIAAVDAQWISELQLLRPCCWLQRGDHGQHNGSA
jgi:hypothetical protein